MRSSTVWFLTSSGWRSTEDRLALLDRECWPDGTLLAGLLEAGPETSLESWTEHWRDAWQPGELALALSRFGTHPEPCVLAAG